jgi:hypothetical protein
MLGFLLPLLGFALLDSLNVLNLGVTSAVVYDSRLSRRSALPGGLSISFLTERVEFEVTPTVRYWGQLALGLILIAVASVSGAARPAPPIWALNLARRNPWLFAIVGIVIGVGQAVTSVPYLTTLTMISARDPEPSLWPLIVIGYCALALVPSMLVLALSAQRASWARRVQGNIIRVTTRYGPIVVRTLLLGAGLVLVVGALVNYRALW